MPGALQQATLRSLRSARATAPRSRGEGRLVHVADAGLGRGVGDHDPAPQLKVAAGRCLEGQLQAVEHHAAVDRSGEVEPAPHGAGRRQDPVDGSRLGHRRSEGDRRRTDDLLGPQRRQLLLADAEGPQHLVGVLAEERCRSAEPGEGA